MLEAIDKIGFPPSIAQSRINLVEAREISAVHPELVHSALNEAQPEGKRVFLDFHAEWCGACRTMETTTFADATVTEVLNEGYLFLKVDTDQHPDLGRHYNVVGLPTIVVLSESGQIVYQHMGQLAAESLLEALAELD